MARGADRTLEGPGTKYEVFGRWEGDGALAHIGSLEAPNIELARARSVMIYSERAWIELCLAPSSAFEKLIGNESADSLGFA